MKHVSQNVSFSHLLSHVPITLELKDIELKKSLIYSRVFPQAHTCVAEQLILKLGLLDVTSDIPITKF